jgi:hypothetical protein
MRLCNTVISTNVKFSQHERHGFQLSEQKQNEATLSGSNVMNFLSENPVLGKKNCALLKNLKYKRSKT